MNALEQLNREKEQALSRISEAARNGNASDVLKESNKLERIESLIQRYAGLINEIENLKRVDEIVSLPPRIDATNSRSAKEVGRTIREEFVDKALRSGIKLKQVKGATYCTTSGSRVGIATATERQPDRWFLGLTKGSFDHAVLLCISKAFGTIEICLPRGFFSEYGHRMSITNGQMKFNVVRKGKAFSILVPGTNGVSASEFLGKYSLLQ